MTKEYFFKKQSIVMWGAVMIACFVVSIAAGAGYCTSVKGEGADGLYQYLSGLFSSFDADCLTVFKNSLQNNMQLFFILFMGGFFRAGVAATVLGVSVKGFCTGFTEAALIKYYGTRGFFISAANIPSALIMIPCMILFAAASAKLSFTHKMQEKNSLVFYLILSLGIIAIFCVSALADGYINTTLMKFIIQKTA